MDNLLILLAVASLFALVGVLATAIIYIIDPVSRSEMQKEWEQGKWI